MDLQTLRSLVRDLVKDEDATNLTDSTLNDLIERCTQRIETDLTNDYGVTPRQMMDRTSQTITATGVDLSGLNFLRARSVSIGDATLRYTSPESLPQESQNEDATVNIVFYKNIPKLVNDTDTNWLLDIASRVYVYGTAIEYTYWNQEDENRAEYIQAYADALEKTSRANSPRPSGGFQRAKGEQRGYYSIIGETMIFGYVY